MSTNTKSVEIFTNQYQIKMATTDDIGYHKNLHRVVLFGKWGMWETPFEGSVQDETVAC